jgi:tetratricopeptide (TPR) repeat protein
MHFRAVRVIALVATFPILLLAAAPAAAQGNELQEANQLFKQGQFDRALDRVNAFLASRPKDARGRFLRGLILTEQKKPDEAIKAFTELTQDYPQLPEPYNNLAVLYASQGQYDKARSALEMAIRIHPGYATAHENLGDIYAKLASQAYEKALQIDRSNSTAETKLNLIKELFPGSPAQPKSDATRPGPATKIAELPAPPPATTQAPANAAELVVKPAAAPDPNEVLEAVNDWAKAWSDNDVASYLAHYAADFKAPDGMTREKWEAQRKARVAKPRRIQVTIEAPKVTFKNSAEATVTFRQHYESDTLKVSGVKILVMVKAGGKWLIQQERVDS